MPQVGDQFPAFSLSDQDGNIVTNSDLLGSKSVVYFYPKDDTPGCTAEACEFQAKLEEIPGEIVIHAEEPSACGFHPRCSRCTDRCRAEVPPLETDALGRLACFNPN